MCQKLCFQGNGFEISRLRLHFHNKNCTLKSQEVCLDTNGWPPPDHGVVSTVAHAWKAHQPTMGSVPPKVRYSLLTARVLKDAFGNYRPK